ncbi:MAG: ATP-dependent RecD-like DNA helicase [Chloroflexota bacterium]|nr:ATP-dependent RecD-like DNA helicase [Chloroflexota bacterium]
MNEQIQGAIERITYFNEDNGYSVIKISPDKPYPRAQARDGTVTVVGIMPALQEGESAQFSGAWVNDERYGFQFRAEQTMPIAPHTAKGVISYLSSGIVKGIGPRTAEKIVKHFGEKTIEILDTDPQRIHEVAELKTKLADNLIDAWTKNRVTRNLLIYLQGLGISARISRRIINEYGAQTQKIIEHNPYQLAEDVFTIGFRKADQIARNLGVEVDAKYRLRAGLHHTLNELSREGHTYAPQDELIETACALLEIEDKQALKIALHGQVTAGKLMEDRLHDRTSAEPTSAIYLPRFFRAETGVASRMRALHGSESVIIKDHRKTDWTRFLRQLSESNDVDLSPQQQGAVRAALSSKVSVLTGGPGTGKTTTLQMLIGALNDGDYAYKLASPTGRAAKRLSEAAGVPASTIHRLLGFSAEIGGFEHDEDNPLPVDMVVIDEASMLDLQLFHSLLRALPASAHLLLVGDVDQLPSVGAGNVLRDIIESGIASVTRLDQIFRQDDDSHIVSNAHRINEGLEPYTGNESKDFFFFNIAEPDAAADMLVDIVRTRIPERWGLHPVRDIQVISPMYRGLIGVDNLNNRLQGELNDDLRLASVKLGGRVFRVGDKVMQTRNNYEKDVFNGDIGYVDSIDDDDNSLEVVMDGRYVAYDYSETDDLMHAYCISTHRSQGSEYPAVVMPVATQHYIMLQRNLLYTAITRARQLLVLVGTRRALWIAVKNNKVAGRHSGLLARLRG